MNKRQMWFLYYLTRAIVAAIRQDDEEAESWFYRSKEEIPSSLAGRGTDGAIS